MRARLAPLVVLAGCTVMPARREPPTPPVVVIGHAREPGAAREGALEELKLRMRAEIERRDVLAAPARRVHDWLAVSRALDEAAPALARAEAIPAGKEWVVAFRVGGDAFDTALERVRAAGLRAPLRVACVPLAVVGGTREVYEVRELYGAVLRSALESHGLEPLATDEVYSALEQGVDLSAVAGARRFGRLAHADAIVSGSVQLVAGELVLEVTLRDARSGRLLGGFGGPVDPAGMASLARRHAIVLEKGLGVE